MWSHSIARGAKQLPAVIHGVPFHIHMVRALQNKTKPNKTERKLRVWNWSGSVANSGLNLLVRTGFGPNFWLDWDLWYPLPKNICCSLNRCAVQNLGPRWSVFTPYGFGGLCFEQKQPTESPFRNFAKLFEFERVFSNPERRTKLTHEYSAVCKGCSPDHIRNNNNNACNACTQARHIALNSFEFDGCRLKTKN